MRVQSLGFAFLSLNTRTSIRSSQQPRDPEVCSLGTERSVGIGSLRAAHTQTQDRWRRVPGARSLTAAVSAVLVPVGVPAIPGVWALAQAAQQPAVVPQALQRLQQEGVERQVADLLEFKVPAQRVQPPQAPAGRVQPRQDLVQPLEVVGQRLRGGRLQGRWAGPSLPLRPSSRTAPSNPALHPGTAPPSPPPPPPPPVRRSPPTNTTPPASPQGVWPCPLPLPAPPLLPPPRALPFRPPRPPPRGPTPPPPPPPCRPRPSPPLWAPPLCRPRPRLRCRRSVGCEVRCVSPQKSGDLGWETRRLSLIPLSPTAPGTPGPEPIPALTLSRGDLRRRGRGGGALSERRVWGGAYSQLQHVPQQHVPDSPVAACWGARGDFPGWRRADSIRASRATAPFPDGRGARGGLTRAPASAPPGAGSPCGTRRWGPRWRRAGPSGLRAWRPPRPPRAGTTAGERG